MSVGDTEGVPAQPSLLQNADGALGKCSHSEYAVAFGQVSSARGLTSHRRAGLLTLLCVALNFGKIWSAC
jgi:hypothetical protein